MYTEHTKFEKASFNSNWDVKQWTKYFGSIPSPHHVHSRAIILVLDQYIHLTEYILVLHY